MTIGTATNVRTSCGLMPYRNVDEIVKRDGPVRSFINEVTYFVAMAAAFGEQREDQELRATAFQLTLQQ